MATKIVFKNLNKDDIVRLALPIKSLNYFPAFNGNKHVVDFQARDECGRVWDFQICTSKNSKYLKPVLSNGWREFVRSKELKVDDRVAFYMEKEEATGNIEYRVRVEKAVRIYGAVFAYREVTKPGE